MRTPAQIAAERRSYDLQFHRARIAFERATWPVLYATVREALALGFLPRAYGNVSPYANDPLPSDDTPRLCPPTLFGFAAGEQQHPLHSGGPGQGARYKVWATGKDAYLGWPSPDWLRDQPVWTAHDEGCGRRGTWAREGLHGSTLPEALAWCIAADQHCRQHFLVPDWHCGDPVLTAREWREVRAVLGKRPVAVAAPRQLDLFAPPPAAPAPPEPTRDERLHRSLATLPDAAADDSRWVLQECPGGWDIDHAIKQANLRRLEAGAPVFSWGESEAAA